MFYQPYLCIAIIIYPSFKYKSNYFEITVASLARQCLYNTKVIVLNLTFIRITPWNKKLQKLFFYMFNMVKRKI